MNQQSRRLLGQGPHPFSLETSGQSPAVEIFQGPKIVIISADSPIHMITGVHSHDSYEFTIALTDMPGCIVGDKVMHVERNQLMTLNPLQPHGCSVPIPACQPLGIQLETAYLQETSRMLFGRTNTEFSNEPMGADPLILGLAYSFIEESRNRQTGYEFILQSLCTQITVNLLRHIRGNMPIPSCYSKFTDVTGIDLAVAYLQENYNRDYSLDEVARLANLSPYHFIRVFKSQTGKTPYSFLLDVKVARAADLLRYSRHSVTEVCFLCGFNNLEHFSNVFKRRMGILPSDYKKAVL